MGTYCNCCDRKVTSAEYPTSCDCRYGDGYCFMCIFENREGVPKYTRVDEVFYVKKEDGTFEEYNQSLFSEDGHVNYVGKNWSSNDM